MSVNSTIVNLNANVVAAPAPSTLQQSGAFVSVGGTTLTTGTWQYCSSIADVTALLSSAGNYLELTKMATTFFAQTGVGSPIGVYILELGVVATAPLGITALTTWIAGNPNIFYAYLVPAAWDASGADLNTLGAIYSSPTGRTYFFPTTSASTISAYEATTKAIFATVPSPTAASTEFQAAAPFYQFLANSPTGASPAAPMAFRFMYGVTPWALSGNQATINTILTAGGNVILTGAEGGISTAALYRGTTMDLNQAMWWYAVDWILINAKQQLAAAIINGSNGAPVQYNQVGINLLLAVLKDLLSSGISNGLLLSGVPAAIPFATYTKANPSDYAAGIYNGFSATVTPQNGFQTITFDLTATQFAS